MGHETTIRIDAPADAVWPVLVDVERWPEWTPSMRRVERLDGGEFSVGSRARIRQPRLPTTVWEVVALDPGRSFTWEARSPGVRTTADHELAPADGGTDVTLRIHERGRLAPLVRLLLGSLTRRYVQQEAEGLKRRCER